MTLSFPGIYSQGLQRTDCGAKLDCVPGWKVRLRESVPLGEEGKHAGVNAACCWGACCWGASHTTTQRASRTTGFSAFGAPTALARKITYGPRVYSYYTCPTRMLLFGSFQAPSIPVPCRRWRPATAAPLPLGHYTLPTSKRSHLGRAAAVEQ